MNLPTQLKDRLRVSEEVADALADKLAPVALESTIISHGMSWPASVETALKVESAVRESGAVPATIAIMNGRLCVGLSSEQIEQIGQRGESALKVSRRDIPFALQDSTIVGSTTVAATMIIASLCDLRVFATGGIGGVHRDAQNSFDISADLQELARTSVAVVCAGAKSILDIGLTKEYLETHGVPVMGYRTDYWPAFYTRRSQYPLDYNLQSADAIAEALHIKWQLPLAGGALVCVPIPQQYSIDEAVIDNAIDDALAQLKRKGISGKDCTPFLLKAIAEITGGDSLNANVELILNNARIAADIAIAYVRAGAT